MIKRLLVPLDGSAQAKQIDLLVMSSLGRSGFTQLWRLAVAEQVIRYAPVPVFVLHRPREGELLRKTSPVALVTFCIVSETGGLVGPLQVTSKQAQAPVWKAEDV